MRETWLHSCEPEDYLHHRAEDETFQSVHGRIIQRVRPLSSVHRCVKQWMMNLCSPSECIHLTGDVSHTPYLTMGTHNASVFLWLYLAAGQKLEVRGRDKLSLRALAQCVMMQPRHLAMTNSQDWLGGVRQGTGIFQEVNLTLAVEAADRVLPL